MLRHNVEYAFPDCFHLLLALFKPGLNGHHDVYLDISASDALLLAVWAQLKGLCIGKQGHESLLDLRVELFIGQVRCLFSQTFEECPRVKVE